MRISNHLNLWTDPGLSTAWWRFRGDAIRDGLVVLGFIFAFNGLFGRSDPGWFNLNPTPWLLLPGFLGARYGLKAGLAGAIAAGVTTLIWRYASHNTQGDGFVQRHAFYFLSLAGAALAGGFAQNIVSRQAEQLLSSSEQLKHDLQSACLTSELLRRDRDRLQEILLIHNAAFSSLSEDLERVAASGPGKWESEFLTLLRKRFSVRGAAIYTASRSRELHLAACSGKSDLFDTILSQGEASPVVRKALESGQMVTCRHLWDEVEGKADDVLAAFPASFPENADSILVVKRMDFDQIHWDNLTRIENVWLWVSCIKARVGTEQAPVAELASLTSGPAMGGLDAGDLS